MNNSLLSGNNHGAGGGLLAWPEFRAGLQNLDLTCLEPAQQQPRSWITDRSFGDLPVRNVGSLGVAVRGERTQQRIGSHREELIWICLVLTGDIRIGQCQRQIVQLSAGDIVMVDTTQPYSIETLAKPNDTLWIGSPRALLAKHIWDIDELLGTRINGSSGPGLIASQVLQAGFTGPGPLAESEANRIAHGLFEVLSVAADSCRLLDAKPNYRNAIVRRIKSYIDEHIEEDTLSVARIASAQRLSSRYVAKMFENEHQTVSGWIRSRRLERCYTALLQADAHSSISEIAYAHGFKNVSHFSRVFKQHYGKTASEVMQDGRKPN